MSKEDFIASMITFLRVFTAAASDEERLAIRDALMKGYCQHCGRADPDGRCQCWNDE